ncbi:CidA/LrgA family protein [Pseudalkalibacillus caeni]|uniref:CidA/LrgA family protein n=1 Tax=Exobacillus caeni TaxID=2574798 RepID=A0A5R9F9W1_9BACL|nr:CidA/LrgA family protein [Pseudalkalibacillus caeni]TLS39056.1 CidA/LrgA family protein [Pseudalkalibacillus caeni]
MKRFNWQKYAVISIQISLLYGLFLIGSLIQTWLGLFVPGSIIGMILLFLLLYIRIIPVKWISTGTELLLNHLPFLFIPVTVGIIQHLGLFGGHSIILIPIIMISTIIVMLVSGGISQAVAVRRERSQSE